MLVFFAWVVVQLLAADGLDGEEVDEFLAGLGQPKGLALDHLQERQAIDAAEGAGDGDGENGFGDQGLDHEAGHDVDFGVGEEPELVVAADEAFEAGFIDVIGPVLGAVVGGDHGELECAVGDVEDAGEQAGGVVIDDGDDAVVAEEHVAGVPVGMDVLSWPGGDAGGFDLGGGVEVGLMEKAEDGGQVGSGGGDGGEGVLDRRLVVVAGGGGLVVGLEGFEESMKQSQDASGVEGGFEGLGVGLAGDVFEEFVNGALGLEHGVVVGLGADEVWQGELLVGEEVLEGVAEDDFGGIVFAAGAAFEETFAWVGGDEECGGFA